MKVINVNEKHEFSSWNEIITICQEKNVHSSKVPNEILIDDIKTIQEKSHKSFFANDDCEYITSLINQFQFYEVNYKYEYSFIDDIHKLAEQIRELKVFPVFDPLFKLGIFTNFGVFSQFLVTIWLNIFFHITNVESKYFDIDSDITIEIGGSEVGIQVKDIREEQRRSRQDHAIYIIDTVLTNRARKARKKQRLSLEKFEGVPPSGLSEDFWVDIANSIVEEPQVKIVEIHPGDGGRNTETIEISMYFGFRAYSGTFEYPAQGFDNTKLLERIYTEINQKLSQYIAHPFILIAITEDIYNRDELKQEIALDNCGILLLDIFDNEVTRSQLIMPQTYEEIENTFNKTVPNLCQL